MHLSTIQIGQINLLLIDLCERQPWRGRVNTKKMKRLEREKCHVDFANFTLYNDILGVINKKYHNLPKA